MKKSVLLKWNYLTGDRFHSMKSEVSIIEDDWHPHQHTNTLSLFFPCDWAAKTEFKLTTEISMTLRLDYFLFLQA